MSYDIPQCHHLHSTGLRCGSPALKGYQFCHNHNQAHIPCLDPKNSENFIPYLESGESIQLATTNILRALAADRLSEKKAYAMFFGIQQLGIAFRHLQKLPDSFVETDIQPGMKRVLDYDGGDPDQLTRAQRIHAKGLDGNHGTLENPLPFSATIETPDEIDGCWVEIPVTKPHAADNGSRSPSSDTPADTTKTLRSASTAQNPVILTANEVSRKDLCTSADTTSKANPRTKYHGPDVPIPSASKKPSASVRPDAMRAVQRDHQLLSSPDLQINDLIHPDDLTHAECRYASSHTLCHNYDDNVVRSYLLSMREGNPEGYSRLIENARRHVAEHGAEVEEDVS